MNDDIRFKDQPKRTALIRLFFGDGEHDFRIRFGELEELQAKLEQGPMRTLLNFDSGDWSPKSVYEIVRLGLIGGGKTPKEAFDLSKRYCLDRPLGETAPLAAAVLSAALMGAPEPVIDNEEPAIG